MTTFSSCSLPVFVTTFAGSGTGGYDDGFGTLASFNAPEGVAYDFTTQILYVADGSNNIIRRILSNGLVNHVYC